jgi:hypothetical protein
VSDHRPVFARFRCPHAECGSQRRPAIRDPRPGPPAP